MFFAQKKAVGGVILKEQNRKSEAAAENRKRGRPAIDIGTTSFLDGTRRTKVNAKYMYEAISLISEAASEIHRSYQLPVLRTRIKYALISLTVYPIRYSFAAIVAASMTLSSL